MPVMGWVRCLGPLKDDGAQFPIFLNFLIDIMLCAIEASLKKISVSCLQAFLLSLRFLSEALCCIPESVIFPQIAIACDRPILVFD